ncbi:CheY-like chemotaxis protein [Pararhizobium capsulatum DSM 1112]|uniref:CheY-like chemotaxis protein n=1 Tax=Pararhizobium capsulatum DSM 1112 TaxID=1121113 RepID=A0ABU0BZK5_9HYPH|nr:response regulator [Pararhizobium capsulatum]MDQ0323139.1 CheY-like chemotaxis protein [Pararhizobium capsulatum DSM 1112]
MDTEIRQLVTVGVAVNICVRCLLVETKLAVTAAEGGRPFEDECLITAHPVEKLGFRALVVNSGEAAKIRLKQASLSVEAILCDIRMPDGDGPAFFDWLRQSLPTLAGRIGFITGDTLGPAAGRFLARSECPVIEKPFTPEDIRRVLGSLVKPTLRSETIETKLD